MPKGVYKRKKFSKKHITNLKLSHLGNKPSKKTKEKMSIAQKKVIHTKEWNKKVSKANKGKKMSEESKNKLSIRNKKLGIKPPSRKGIKDSIETRKRKSEAQKLKIKNGTHNLWEGGKTKEAKIIRGSIEYRLWREAVFARDNWTCQNCKKRCCELHPHHIKPFSLYPKLRLAIDNGITLCVECHKKTDTYAGKGLKRIKNNK